MPWFTQWSETVLRLSNKSVFKVGMGSTKGHNVQCEKSEKKPDQIIFQGQKPGTVCSTFFIFLLMNRLAVCLDLHAAPWCSEYCAPSSQTNSVVWASALSVFMLHNQDGLSVNRDWPNKYQPPPADKQCVSPRTHSVSLHVHNLLRWTSKNHHLHLSAAVYCYLSVIYRRQIWIYLQWVAISHLIYLPVVFQNLLWTLSTCRGSS